MEEEMRTTLFTLMVLLVLAAGSIAQEGEPNDEVVLELYDIKDLTMQITDYPPIGVDLDEGTLYMDEVEHESTSPEELVARIKKNIASETWGSDNCTIEVKPNEQLLIRHFPDVQKQIQEFLREIRRERGRMVKMEARCILIPFEERAQLMKDIGAVVRRTSTGNAGWQSILNAERLETLLKAVSDEGYRTSTAPTLTAFHRQRSNISVLTQQSIITDYEEEPETGILDPVIEVISEGTVIDLRATLSEDNRLIRIQGALHSARLLGMETFDWGRSIEGDHLQIAVPQLDAREVAFDVTLRDGLTVLIPGPVQVGEDGGKMAPIWLLTPTVIQLDEDE
jgi:hypothetical protein